MIYFPSLFFVCWTFLLKLMVVQGHSIKFRKRSIFPEFKGNICDEGYLLLSVNIVRERMLKYFSKRNALTLVNCSSFCLFGCQKHCNFRSYENGAYTVLHLLSESCVDSITIVIRELRRQDYTYQNGAHTEFTLVFRTVCTHRVTFVIRTYQNSAHTGLHLLSKHYALRFTLVIRASTFVRAWLEKRVTVHPVTLERNKIIMKCWLIAITNFML